MRMRCIVGFNRQCLRLCDKMSNRLAALCESFLKARALRVRSSLRFGCSGMVTAPPAS